MDWKKRVYCGDVRSSHAGSDVLVIGWVDAVRDHGNVLFIHLRDISGMVQVVFNPQQSKECYDKAGLLREEYVVKVVGEVSFREKGTENPNLKTGDIEIFAKNLEVISVSKGLPFQISEKAMVFGEDIKASPENVDEELRLRYRYLDLRRPSMQELLIKRYKIIKCIREYLDEMDFIEVETPFLTRSTPEGARDYLVPSRVHQGKFYALPQSPQLFKQILMISGMDRYFQIARCFRDEDLRPNRQPEFTQLDLEASFVDEEFIFEVIEELTARMFKIGGVDLPRPFPRMTYREAVERFGTDRPDLRFGMGFEDLTDIVRDTGYSVFRQIINAGGSIKGFCVKDPAGILSKNVLQNEYAMKTVPLMGARGMSWMKVAEGGFQSSIVQFFSPSERAGLMNLFQAEDGDVLMMIADSSRELVNNVLSSLRTDVAERLGLIPPDRYCPLWVTDFPLFELKDDQINSQHHPFTMPDRTDFDPADREGLLAVHSRAYDLVMNGEELGGGSIRIHDMEIQEKVFRALGLSGKEVDEKFGFFLKALEYGAPPHAGLALGLDRVVSMILGTRSIRDVMAFPKNRRAFCPLTRAPSFADASQLQELGLSVSSKGSYQANGEGIEDTGVLQGASERKAEKISKEKVYHVAKLARLRISDSEADSFRKDLNSILDYVESLGELNTEDVEPMSHVLEMKNVWRDDIPGKDKEPESLLSNAPLRDMDYFKVPKILEG